MTEILRFAQNDEVFNYATIGCLTSTGSLLQ